ncbi:MAG: serine/threonine-protein kinase [Polyangiales bacterium]
MQDGATADTLAADSLAAPSKTASTLTGSTFARSTVLPRHRPLADQVRYELVRPLGEGGMGEVVLVTDHDIGRQVAVKRLKAGPQEQSAVLRFAEEVRTVGHLEHPGIVPIHDVGVDENGQHYLVMKYVEGETLEQIIHQLKQGNPEYLDRFHHTHRAQVFVSLLQALRYAHEKGIIHRDLKPANVMVGPYGEVMLMDWGIAKKIERGAKDEVELGHADTADSNDPKRLVQTAHGALLGTPLYMSPEQALGRTRELDERSDIYSATLLFVELMTLSHPYANKKTVQELLVAQAKEEISAETLRDLAFQSQLPMEFVWFAIEGLDKNPTARFQSVAEMERQLSRILSGKVRMQCHVTATKRVLQEIIHWIDRHPLAFTAMLFLTTLGMLASLVLGVIALVRR